MWPNASSTENLQKRDTFSTVYSKKLKITHKKNVSIKGRQSFSFLSSRSLGRSVKTKKSSTFAGPWAISQSNPALKKRINK